jgi:7-cyano-7-deazaguanine synthase
LPIRKGAAELCGAANSTDAELDSMANSKNAELSRQNFIETNSAAELDGQNFTASNFMTSPADALLSADLTRNSGGCAQKDEILTQGGEASLGDNEISPQDGEILPQSGAEPQQGDKISSKRAESEISPQSQNNKISLQSQSDKISPPSGESAFSDLPSTYVPFRNGVFLSIAAALAEKERCDAIFIGVVQEDSSGYPDCGASFIAAFERALELGTSRDFHPRIKTPLVHLSKAQIVSLALKIGVPLELTWSCYEREDAACGLCDSCLLRLKGFAGAGAKDKIPYAIEA